MPGQRIRLHMEANFLLSAWQRHRPVHCDTDGQRAFSCRVGAAGARRVQPYRLSSRPSHGARGQRELSRFNAGVSATDLSPSTHWTICASGCPETLGDSVIASHSAYGEALTTAPLPDDRHETLVILPPTPQASDHFRRYLRYFNQVEKNVVVVAGNAAGQVDVWSNKSTDLESQNAVLAAEGSAGIRARGGPKQTMSGFLERFKYCEPIYADATVVVDLYCKSGHSLLRLGQQQRA